MYIKLNNMDRKYKSKANSFILVIPNNENRRKKFNIEMSYFYK